MSNNIPQATKCLESSEIIHFQWVSQYYYYIIITCAILKLQFLKRNITPFIFLFKTMYQNRYNTIKIMLVHK